MRKSSPQIWNLFVLLAALAGAARGQAVAEYGRMARQSSTATAKTYHTSKEIGGVWSSLDKTLKGSPDNAASQEPPARETTRRARVPSTKAGAKRALNATTIYEDPSHIQPGIGYEELIRRFGPPSFAVTTAQGTQSLAYPGKVGGIDLELLDGKVTKVTTAKPQEIAVGAPQ